jgi:hypothetical protein
VRLPGKSVAKLGLLAREGAAMMTRAWCFSGDMHFSIVCVASLLCTSSVDCVIPVSVGLPDNYLGSKLKENLPWQSLHRESMHSRPMACGPSIERTTTIPR